MREAKRFLQLIEFKFKTLSQVICPFYLHRSTTTLPSRNSWEQSYTKYMMMSASKVNEDVLLVDGIVIYFVAKRKVEGAAIEILNLHSYL